MINNTGIFQKSAGGSTSTINAYYSTTAGNTKGLNGTLAFTGGGSTAAVFTSSVADGVQFNGGTFTIGTGSAFGGVGSYLLSSGVLNVTAPSGTPATMTNLDFAGGSINGGGTLKLTGPNSQWSGGLIGTGGGSLTVGAGATLTVANTNNITIDGFSSGYSLDNQGTLVWSGTATNNWYMQNGGVINNSGTFDIQNNLTILNNGGALPVINNNSGGIFRKSAGVATSSVSVAFNNNAGGTIDGQSGTLQFAGTLSQSGSLNVGTGAVVQKIGGITNTGTITGAGTIDVGIGNALFNNGIVNPGGIGVVGTLTINGHYSQGSGGSLDVDLASGVSYDSLTVTGNAAITGTLSVNYLSAYTGGGGSHAILTSAANSGTFTTINDANTLTTNYGATSFTLTGGTLNTWTGGAADFLWASGGNWSFGHEPTAAENAQVPDLTGSPIIHISTGSHTPKSFSFLGDETFSIDGGSLSFANASALLNGTFKLNGGNVTANGSLTTKTLDLTGGLLNGSGSLTVTNAFTQSGGTIGSSGNLSITQAAGNLIFANAINAAAITLNANAGNIVVQDAMVGASGTLNATASGNLNVIATTAPTQLQSGGLQTINANGIHVQGGAGTGLTATLTGNAGQSITVGAAGIAVDGGATGTNNGAMIQQFGTASNQSITVNGGGTVALNGGGGTQNFALITNDGKAQSISFTAGGALNLQGGNGAGGQNQANISNNTANATTQTISFAGGGTINVSGGDNTTNDNSAEIHAFTGNQSILGNADINLTGGSSGGTTNNGNSASISIKTGAAGVQTVNAHNLKLQGGAGGLENVASLSTEVAGQTQIVTTSGTVQILGGAGTDAVAILGNNQANADITVNATGGVTLTGGNGGFANFGAVALLGAVGGFNANVTVNGQAGVTLNKGAGLNANALIGSDTAGGTVTLKAGLGGAGSLALNDGIVKTSNGVTLQATAAGGQITETTGSVLASSLNTSSNAGTALAGNNTVATFHATNSTSGAINFNNTGALTLSGVSNSGGSITVGAAGTLQNTAAVTTGAGANIALTATGGTQTIGAAVTAGGAGTVTLKSTGASSDIVLNAAVGSSSGAITLASGRNFVNNAGAGALATSGNWQVWSANPASDTRGGLAYNFKQYNATYGVTTVLGSGNGFLYTVAPTVTAGLTGSVTKTYNASTVASLGAGNYSVSGAIDGDTVTLNNPASGTYASQNFGSGINVSVSGIAIAGANNGGATVYGYTLGNTSANANIGSISKAALALNAVTDSKVYNGNTNSAVAPVAVGLAGSDTVSSFTQSFASKNALGAGLSTLNVNSGYVVNDGNGGNNYTVTLNSASGTLSRAALALNAVTDSKTYNGNANSGVAPVAVGLVGGDTVSSFTQSFASKNALGAGLSTLSVNGGYVLNDGNSGNNYNVTLNTATGTISRAALSLNAVTDSKIYNGNTNSAQAPTSSGLVGGDTVSSLSQSFASKNVLGAGLSTLNVNGGYVVSDGNSGNNYNVTLNTASGTITAKALALNAVTDSKIYDGNTGSVATPAAVGLVGGDTVSAFTQSFASKNVLGAGLSTLNVNSGYVVNDGNGGNNYSVAQNSAAGTINRASLTITAQANSKTYDGNTSSLTTPAVSGLVGGDTVTGATQTYAARNVGNNITLTVGGGYTVNDGNAGGNYNVNTVTSNTGTITQLGSVTWTGPATGNWSSAGNWAGGALPDGSNVAQVVIPVSTTVNYDLAAPTTLNQLNSSGTLNMTTGSLAINSSLTTAGYQQSAGSVGGTGSFTVTQSYSRSGGTLAMGGAVGITQAAGNLSISQPLTGSTINLSATAGSISETGAGTLSGGMLTTSSNGGTLLGGSNTISGFNAINVSSGSIQLNNTGALTVAGISQSGGSGVSVTNAGTLTVSGAVNAGGAGGIALTASGAASDLTANAGLVAGAGTLNASAGRDVIINVASSGSDVTLNAGRNIAINNGVAATNNLTLIASGALNMGDAIALAGNDATVTAGALSMISGSGVTQLRSANNMVVTIAGASTLQGGSSANAYAEIRNVAAGNFTFKSGDLLLQGGSASGAYARLFGNPDVNLTVTNGTVRINGAGAGAYAAVEAVSPTSVHLNFPALTSGGYSVNGVPGAVYDATTSSGFIAGGAPAVFGTNLLVTYSGVLVTPPAPPATVQQQISQVTQQIARVTTPPPVAPPPPPPEDTTASTSSESGSQQSSNSSSNTSNAPGDRAPQSVRRGKPAVCR